jgi:hypothetical protein
MESDLHLRESQEISKIVAKIKRAAPRDGHGTALVGERYMLVFGGDRSQMPFNELLLLDLNAEMANVQQFNE